MVYIRYFIVMSKVYIIRGKLNIFKVNRFNILEQEVHSGMQL